MAETSSNTQIINSSFVDCVSFGEGGAITWLGQDGKIIDVHFTNMTAFEAGGAIYGSGNNMEIVNSTIKFAAGVVSYREVYVDYLSGSGICWVDSNNLQIINTNIMPRRKRKATFCF